MPYLLFACKTAAFVTEPAEPIRLVPIRPPIYLRPSIAVYTVSGARAIAAFRTPVQTADAPKIRWVTLRLQYKMRVKIRSTTVLCVRRDGKVVMAGDGQVTLGHEVIKGSARKLRRLYNDKVIAGFAGSTADAFALFSRFESKLEQFNGNLSRSVVELAKEWRTDRVLRHLEALLLVADKTQSYLVSGNGDVVEPDEGVAAIGSGGPFALSAAVALLRNTKLSARRIAEESMAIAGKTCIYTNENITYEELE